MGFPRDWTRLRLTVAMVLFAVLLQLGAVTTTALDLSCSGANVSGAVLSGEVVTKACESACTFSKEEEEGLEDPNFGLAFLLVTCAGLSTSIGAGLVFIKGCVTKTNDKVLAASLGFSGGVMIYVSFGEILQKSVGAFTDCDCLWEHEDPTAPARVMATIMFFAGVAFYIMLDQLVHCLIPRTVIKRKRRKNAEGGEDTELEMNSSSIATTSSNKGDAGTSLQSDIAPQIHPTHIAISESFHMDNQAIKDAACSPSMSVSCESCHDGCSHESNDHVDRHDQTKGNETKEQGEDLTFTVTTCIGDDCHDEHKPTTVIDLDALSDEERRSALNRMGMMTALAIGLHNFPEGLATFVGALANPSVGIALAVAIAIHNIPEGLCVSIPIYYATGSRCRGFWLATASGVAEIVGAALGYAFLISIFDDVAYAILFGLVSGMMVAIVISELLPTAQRYDPHGKTATCSFFAGMAVMAISLVLFIL